MSVTTIRYAVTNDDVLLTIARDGSPYAHARLSHSDMKRLAWGVLADLDPDEAHAVQIETHERPPPLTPIWRNILRQLYRSGACGTGKLRRNLPMVPQIPAHMAALIDRGFVQRVDGESGRGRPATYAITDRGRTILLETDA